MNISTNELFHFTELEKLKMILESKSFLPRYSLEFTHLSNAFGRKATFMPIAMTCFCDIPFEHSKTHRERYGNYGIALTEKWKLSKKLNPVFYVQFDSFLANTFADFVNILDDFIPIIQENKAGNNIPYTLSRVGHNLTFLSFFLKQFENSKNIHIDYAGKIRKFEKRRFYDEREWRYIPFEADNSNRLILDIADFDNPQKLEIAHKHLENFRLTFDYDDIKYLIVTNESEKIELEKITQKEIEVLIAD